MTLKEIQQYELNILKFIDEICTKNGIKYYLAYGSLLGAVRHGGFIPWDDDIDIWMTRKDYYKLAKIMKKNNDGRYRIVSNKINPRFRAPLPKIVDSYTVLKQRCGYIEGVDLGVYVDLVILDGCGDNYKDAAAYYKKANKIHKKWKYSNQSIFVEYHNKIYCIARALKNLPYKIVGYQHYLNKITQFDRQKDFYSSKYVAALDFQVYPLKNSILKRSLFGSGSRIQFMDASFMAPDNPDELLKTIYGDYMKLPPKDKQVSHHTYDVEILHS